MTNLTSQTSGSHFKHSGNLIPCRSAELLPVQLKDKFEILFSPADIDAAAIEVFSILPGEVSRMKRVEDTYQHAIINELVEPISGFAAYVSNGYYDIAYKLTADGCIVTVGFANERHGDLFAQYYMDNVYSDEYVANYTVSSDELEDQCRKLAASPQLIGNHQLLVQEAVAGCIKKVLQKAKRLKIPVSGYCHPVVHGLDEDVEVIFRFATECEADTFESQVH